MSRARTGQLIHRRSGYACRVTVTVDGERLRRVFDLGTQSKGVATRKMRALIARLDAEESGIDAAAAEASGPETLDLAAERIFDRREAEGLRSSRDERNRYARRISPIIGSMPVTAIRRVDVQRVLDESADAGLALQTLRNIRGVLRTVLMDLWRDEIIPAQLVDRIRMPRAKVDKRERCVLTDAELVTYLGWSHPEERYAHAVRQRQAMAAMSRVFGGLRSGDLHVLRWEHFSDDFATGWAPRRKTASPQALVVPELLRPILRDWWERHGRPASGLLFPSLRGKRVGETKRGTSHAGAMRRDLLRAFGLERWDPNNRAWKRSGEPTERQKELLDGSEHRRAADFHSFRRAYGQALATAGVNVQESAALTGHADLAAHQRYLRNTSRPRELPAAALPDLKAWAVPNGRGSNRETPCFAEPPSRLELETYGLRNQVSSNKHREIGVTSGHQHGQSGHHAQSRSLLVTPIQGTPIGHLLGGNGGAFAGSLWQLGQIESRTVAS